MACEELSNAPDEVKESLPVIESEKAKVNKKSLSAQSDPDFIPTPARIVISPDQLVMSEGNTATMVAIGYYSYDTMDLSKHVTWTSDNPDVVSFLAKGTPGLASTTGVGKATITAEFKGITAQTTLEVIAAQIDALDLAFSEEVLSVVNDGAGKPIPKEVSIIATGVFTNKALKNLSSAIFWKSSNPDIAEFPAENSPQILLKMSGEITISATWDTQVFDKLINITQGKIELVAIKINPSPIISPLGGIIPINVTGTYNNGSTKDITSKVALSSLDPSVIKFLNNSNQIQGSSQGATTVKAELDGITEIVTAITSSSTLTSVSISPPNVSQPLGVTLQYKAEGTYSDGTVLDVTSMTQWTSSDQLLASLSNTDGTKGQMTSTNKGDLIVTGSLQGFDASTTVVITDPELSRIEVTPTSITLAEGKTKSLLAIGHYTDGTATDITQSGNWNSSDANVMTVTNTGSRGIVEGAGIGSTTITISHDGISKSIPVIVTEATVERVWIESKTNDTSMAFGQTLEYIAKAELSNNSTILVTNDASWSVDVISDGYSFAASVDNEDNSMTKGLITSIAIGLTNVIASYQGEFNSLEVEVTEKEIKKGLGSNPDGVELIIPSGTLTIGDTQQLIVRATFTDNTILDITDTSAIDGLTTNYSTEDTIPGDVLTISATGYVTAAQEGGATINVIVNTPWGDRLSNTASAGVYSDCLNGDQTKFSFYCVYLSAFNESCTSFCSTKGGYNTAASYIFGSTAGQNTSCQQVLLYIDPVYSAGTIELPNSNGLTGEGVGCGILESGAEYTAQIINPATTADGSMPDFKRMCTCNN